MLSRAAPGCPDLARAIVLQRFVWLLFLSRLWCAVPHERPGPVPGMAQIPSPFLLQIGHLGAPSCFRCSSLGYKWLPFLLMVVVLRESLGPLDLGARRMLAGGGCSLEKAFVPSIDRGELGGMDCRHTRCLHVLQLQGPSSEPWYFDEGHCHNYAVRQRDPLQRPW